jgi:DAACS family dicarboxylate/amino acid:cation (Na+ or H+) symporter
MAAGGHRAILIGLGVGATTGLLANVLGRVTVGGPADSNGNGVDDRVDWVAFNVGDTLGQVFLRLMSMMVVPLVLSALALAVVGLGDVRRLGRLGLRTLFWTATFSITAVTIGVLLVNVIRPGEALSPERRADLKAQYAERPATGDAGKAIDNARKAKTLRDTLLDIIPKNPLQEMVGALDGSSPGGGMLSVMFFAIMLGLAATTSGDNTRTLTGWLEGLYEVSMTVIGWAMRLAPLGAGGLVFAVTARLGFDILASLGWFVACVIGGLLIQQYGVYSLALLWSRAMSPVQFFLRTLDAQIVAFSTSSSSATLPTAIRVANESLKLPPTVSNFVLTVGATGNQNGTGLFEGVVVLFLAQLFTVDLSLGDQIRVVLMSVLAGVGTAGVPGGSIPLIVVLLESIGVPGAGIGVVLGIDRILDMSRTVVNVTGDLAVATCVSAQEARAPVSGSHATAGSNGGSETEGT